MISTTWWVDPTRNADCLRCESIDLAKGTLDTVNVYFYSKFDVDTIKDRNLEMTIARTIFLNRSKYGSSVDATLDVYPNSIHFRTGTDAEIYNEYWPINLEGAEQ